MRYVDTAEMGGNMNHAGPDATITDTILPTLATQLVPDRATAGQATTTAAAPGELAARKQPPPS